MSPVVTLTFRAVSPLYRGDPFDITAVRVDLHSPTDTLVLAIRDALRALLSNERISSVSIALRRIEYSVDVNAEEDRRPRVPDYAYLVIHRFGMTLRVEDDDGAMEIDLQGERMQDIFPLVLIEQPQIEEL